MIALSCFFEADLIVARPARDDEGVATGVTIQFTQNPLQTSELLLTLPQAHELWHTLGLALEHANDEL